MKTLFPLLVPPTLPAFDKEKVLRYYFKPSAANTFSQIAHIQLSIVRLDTNRTLLNKNDYPFGIKFYAKSEIAFDENKKMYFVEVPISATRNEAVVKIQVRAGETPFPSLSDTAAFGIWLKEETTLNSFSEWSIVTTTMSITPPRAGLVNLTDEGVNTIKSSSEKFVGYYEPKDEKQQESLKQFQLNLYSCTSFDDSKTWRLVSTSGVKNIGIYDKVNISHTFDREMKNKSKYIIQFIFRTKNSYSRTINYNIDVLYPELEIYSPININPNWDDGLIELELPVDSKQVFLVPVKDATVSFIKDQPGAENLPELNATHAVFNGMYTTEPSVNIMAIDNIIIVQTKIKFTKPVFEDYNDSINNPYLLLRRYGDISGELIEQIKLCAIKVDISSPTSGNLNPPKEWEYRFMLRHERVANVNGKKKMLSTGTRSFTSNEAIVPAQEYYFFIKSDSGNIIFDVKKTYRK